jgi:leucyl aminopeptidase (aminopeptidase T)
MEEGMCSNYNNVSKLTHKLYDFVKNAKKVEIENPAGTKLRVKLNPDWKWIKSDGFIHENGKWGNLPDGELFTAVAESNGEIVIDELGDWFNNKYGCLTKPENRLDTPVHVEIKNSRVKYETIESTNPKLKQDVMNYIKTDNNSDRLGEFALPTNIELMNKPLIGNLLQDEKGRVHVAFGDPFPKETGANWQSLTHLDCLIKNCSVWVDGNKIMESDKYVLE